MTLRLVDPGTSQAELDWQSRADRLFAYARRLDERGEALSYRLWLTDTEKALGLCHATGRAWRARYVARHCQQRAELARIDGAERDRLATGLGLLRPVEGHA